jgi:SepF-like predicted cell division protein (DUF552 family)
MKQKLIEQVSSEHAKHRQFVETSFPSIYTKEDVCKILDELVNGVYASLADVEETTSETLSELQIESIANDVAEMVGDLGMDIVNDYELEMSYREVELSSVEISERQIRSIVTEVIKATLGQED